MKQDPWISRCCGGKAIATENGFICKLCNQATPLILKSAYRELKLKARYEKQIKKLKEKPANFNKLKKELWAITSKIVRASDNKCFTCDKPLEYKQRNPAHFWSQGGHQTTRFDFDNLRVCCTSCNSFKSGNLAEYGYRLMAELGQERFDALARRAHTAHKWDKEELAQMIAERTEILNNLR